MVSIKDSLDTPDLQDAEEQAASGGMSGFGPYDPSADADPAMDGRVPSAGTVADIKRGLRGRSEQTAAQALLRGANDSEQSLGLPDSQPKSPIKRKRKRPSRRQIAFFSAPLVVGIIGGLIALIILLGLFQIPNLAANIARYEFVALTRQAALATDRVAQEELATEAASEGTAAAGNTADNPGGTFGEEKSLFDLKARFPRTAALFDTLNSKINPAKVISNLHADSGLTINYKTSKLTGRLVLQNIELDGTTYSIKGAIGIGRVLRWIPVFRDIAAVRDQAALYRSIRPALIDALDAQDAGVIMRTLTLAQFRREAGIGLVAFVASKFDRLSPDQSRILQTREEYAAINGTDVAPDEPTTEAAQEAKDAVAETEKQVVENDQELLGVIKNPDTFVQKITSVMGQFISDDWTAKVLNGALGIIDPLYAIALPLCIIYDGSVQSSGPTISHAVRRQIAAANYIQSFGDEEKAAFARGIPSKDTLGEINALRAGNAAVGDTSGSIPIRRAEGFPVDTSTQISAEAGASGGYYYDIFSALGIAPNSGAGKAISGITSNACGVLTNTATAVGIGIVNVAGALITFGGTEAGEEAAGQGATAFLKIFISSMVKNLFAKEVVTKGATVIERGLLNRAFRFVFFQGLIIGGTVGATELMKLVVVTRAQLGTSGLAQGADLITNADAGTNLLASETQRVALFGRPLTSPEVTARDTADTQYLAYENSRQSFTERYFAFSNPDSLAAHMANVASSILRPDFVATFVSGGSALFAPLQNFGSLLHVFGVAYAAPDPNTQHYGNVQFGWSEDEEKLIDSDYGYMPLENQKILEESGKENEIAQKYATCFEYDYNSSGDGALDPSDPNGNLQLNINGNGDIGKLLASGQLPRDSNGNVINDSDSSHCTPQNLGINNPAYGDLVFRWRLAMQYDLTIGRLTELQTLTN